MDVAFYLKWDFGRHGRGFESGSWFLRDVGFSPHLGFEGHRFESTFWFMRDHIFVFRGRGFKSTILFLGVVGLSPHLFGGIVGLSPHLCFLAVGGVCFKCCFVLVMVVLL